MAVAVPAAAVLVALVHAGGAAFAVALAAVAVLGQLELARLGRIPRTAAAPGAAAAGALPLLALGGGGAGLVAAAAVVATAAGGLAAAAAPAGGRLRAAGVAFAGVVWLGGCLAHAVLLRELPHGAGLVIDVLLVTFLGDTAAQLFGSAFGRRRLAPAISPNKTVEGLLAGIVVGTAACAVAAVAFQDWFEPVDAVVLGLACALAAPAGDLFESALKRRAGVKDSGRLFGAHGGVLDRCDAALAAALVGFYVVRALGVA